MHLEPEGTKANGPKPKTSKAGPRTRELSQNEFLYESFGPEWSCVSWAQVLKWQGLLYRS